MLLAQGAELSKASEAISSLTSRLEQLIRVEGATWDENSGIDKSEESASVVLSILTSMPEDLLSSWSHLQSVLIKEIFCLSLAEP